MLLNNLAKCFNAWIKESRSKPILTMLEDICCQIMARFQQKKNGIRSANFSICPKIQKKLERSKSDARNCISHWQNELEFEVDYMYDARRIVILDKYTCNCGRWQLNGIPCPHACAAIYLHKEKLEKYVDACYKMESTWKDMLLEYLAWKGQIHGQLMIHVIPLCHLLLEGLRVDRR
jgi:hypothetical protein